MEDTILDRTTMEDIDLITIITDLVTIVLDIAPTTNIPFLTNTVPDIGRNFFNLIEVKKTVDFEESFYSYFPKISIIFSLYLPCTKSIAKESSFPKFFILGSAPFSKSNSTGFGEPK